MASHGAGVSTFHGIDLSATYQYSKISAEQGDTDTVANGPGRSHSLRAIAASPSAANCIRGCHRCLRLHPFDQLVELDRLLGRGQRVGSRKSVFAGGFSSAAGGSG